MTADETKARTDGSGARYSITVRIAPDCARLEVTRPFKDNGAWLSLIDAVADRWGSYACSDGEHTVWAELDWRGPLPREGR